MWRAARHGAALCMRSAAQHATTPLAETGVAITAAPCMHHQWGALQAYSSGTSDAAMRSAEKLLDLMSSSPALQQMMLASLPPQMRGNPEVIKAMLADPGVKQKIVEMMAKQGVQLPAEALDKMNAGHMEETFARLRRVGINPTEIPQKLMAYPGVFKKLQEPSVMKAFLETAENPAAAAIYNEDVMAVVRKAQELLRTPTPQAESTGAVQDATVLSYSQSAPSTPSGALPTHVPPPPSSPPRPDALPPPVIDLPPPAADPTPAAGLPFMHLLSQDPSLAAKLQSPRVQKALEEISKSPWKTIKYVFDKDVMEVFTALNKLLKAGGKPKQ